MEHDLFPIRIKATFICGPDYNTCVCAMLPQCEQLYRNSCVVDVTVH